jgi:hypothetical protein
MAAAIWNMRSESSPIMWYLCVSKVLTSLIASSTLLPPHVLDGRMAPLFLPVSSAPLSVSLQTIDQQVCIRSVRISSVVIAL